MSVPKRKVIGYFDPETDEIIPNKKRKSGEKQTVSAKSAGCYLLFTEAAEKTGLLPALKKVYPNQWEKLLTCAYYLLSEGNTLSHGEQWAERTLTPLGKRFSSQRIFDKLPEFNQEPLLQVGRGHDKICYYLFSAVMYFARGSVV